MNKLWSDETWEQYLAWQSEDRKTLKRINSLIEDAEVYDSSGLAFWPATGSLEEPL